MLSNGPILSGKISVGHPSNLGLQQTQTELSVLDKIDIKFTRLKKNKSF